MAVTFEVPATTPEFPLGAPGATPFEIEPNIFGEQEVEEEDPLEGV